MASVFCEGCGKSILAGVRYPLEPLVAPGSSMSAACEEIGISGSTFQAARCHGLLREYAEKVADRMKMHPYELWPGMAEDDVAAASQPCAECEGLFIPTRKGHIYCSPSCRQRKLNREWMRRKYRTDPEYRERKRAARKVLYEEGVEYERARQRRYYNRTGQAEKRRERYRTDPEYREMVKRWSRERYARLKEAS